MSFNLLNKTLVIGMIVFFICISITPSIAVDTIKKPPMPISNGKILYVGGTGEGNYTSIQKAINDASDGDTVFVYDDSSPYYENVVVDKSINLIGEDKDNTIIDGGGVGDVVNVSADWVNISGFTIQNGGEVRRDAGINARSNYSNFIGNIIKNNGLYGVYLRISIEKYSHDNIISNNYICNNGLGVYLNRKKTKNVGLENNTISDNTIISNSCGIHLMHCRGEKVVNNSIINNYRSIKIELGTLNIIKNNEISSSVKGIWVLDTKNNVITGNNIRNHSEYAITMVACDFTDISYNTFSNNNQGIISMSSVNNIFYHNNFINNSRHAFDEDYNYWDNGYPSGGNYWDDYNGTDNDGDGIGDTPYPISGGDNEDRYPLMYPTVNVPPDNPIINGPTSGKPNTEYDFTFNAIDPNDDAVIYFVDWGDNNTDWTEYSDSGKEIILKHSWDVKGVYTIKAKAIDIHGAESDWSEFWVEIPRNRATYNSWFQIFFDRFPLLEVFLRAMNLLR